MKRILFICTGNTCRSPLAEGLLRKMAEEAGLELEVRSAGVHAMDGGMISNHTAEILREQGAHTDIISSSVSLDLIRWADLILTMTAGHKGTVTRQFPQALDKTFTLKEFVVAEPNGDLDISDPFGGSLEIYRETAAEIEARLRELLQKLREYQD